MCTVEFESGIKDGSASFAETDATRDHHVKGKTQLLKGSSGTWLRKELISTLDHSLSL